MTRSARTDRDAVRLALLGLVATVLTFLLASNLSRLPLVGGGDLYRAEFTDTAGLQKGEEVRVAGIKVGEVSDIELDRGKVVVSFRVRGEKLGDATTASIEVKTLLGQHYLAIAPDGEGTLAEGATIPLERTTTPVNIVPAFQQLTTQVEQIDTRRVASAFDALSATLESTAPDTARLLDGLSRLSRTVSSRDDELASLLDRASRVSGVVADRDRELAQLIAGSAEVLEVLQRRRAAVSAVIRETRQLAVQLDGLVEDSRRDLAPVLEDLDTVLGVLTRNRRNIDDIVTYASVYAREFTNVAGTGPWFDVTMTMPRELSLCAADTSTLGPLVDSVLRTVTQLLYGSAQQCLPLGQAPGGP
ncbi:MAG TPA: MlaD family protein [Nocardioidaceae bacterium]|nr:MlaD family protein [Nocardioidaceae bacterium]